MGFELRFDDASIACSSPRCVQKLLSQGWRLADRSQTAELLEALKEIEDAEPARALLPRTLPRGPESLGDGRP